MIIGTKQIFAIESRIYEISERPSLRGLGYFVVHIGGEQFGVKSPRATMLANSFDEVCRRLSEQGSHIAPFAASLDALQLASVVQNAVYGELEVSGDCRKLSLSLKSEGSYGRQTVMLHSTMER